MKCDNCKKQCGRKYPITSGLDKEDISTIDNSKTQWVCDKCLDEYVERIKLLTTKQ